MDLNVVYFLSWLLKGIAIKICNLSAFNDTTNVQLRVVAKLLVEFHCKNLQARGNEVPGNLVKVTFSFIFQYIHI